MANGEPTWYTDAIARMENGEWVARRSGHPLMSDPDKAYIRVVPFEDYAALAAQLAEAKGLLEEIGGEWPAVKRTTVERAYAFIERPTDSADDVCDECDGSGIVRYLAYDGTENGHEEQIQCPSCTPVTVSAAEMPK